MSAIAPPQVPSIHFQRRWFYALWVLLLLLSASALFLWERPLRTERASYSLSLQISHAPAQTQIQVWAGPKSKWPGLAWRGEGAFASFELPETGSLSLPLLKVPIARRRWVKDYIPRKTWDLVMIKFLPPNGSPRFLAVSLHEDIQAGVLRPHSRLIARASANWNVLHLDGKNAELSLK